MKKQQAIEILNATAPSRSYGNVYDIAHREGGVAFFEALDRAGLFMSEETAAEIAHAGRSADILRNIAWAIVKGDAQLFTPGARGLAESLDRWLSADNALGKCQHSWRPHTGGAQQCERCGVCKGASGRERTP